MESAYACAFLGKSRVQIDEAEWLIKEADSSLLGSEHDDYLLMRR